MKPLIAVLMLSTVAHAEDTCAQLAAGLARIDEVPADERASVALGTAADLCGAKLTPAFRDAVKSIIFATPESRVAVLGAASKDDAFEAACTGWKKSKLAEDFASGGKVTGNVFKTCRFDRLKVVSAAEFSKADVHFATTALVLYDALVKSGVKAELAKKAALTVIQNTSAR